MNKIKEIMEMNQGKEEAIKPLNEEINKHKNTNKEENKNKREVSDSLMKEISENKMGYEQKEKYIQMELGLLITFN